MHRGVKMDQWIKDPWSLGPPYGTPSVLPRTRRQPPMSWSLVTVAPNAEARACYNMALFDFPHHVFKLPCQVVVRGQVRERLRPAFPGYAIVDVGDRWRELKEVSGVTGFVRGTEGHIAALSDTAVRDLLADCSPDHPDDEVLVV